MQGLRKQVHNFLLSFLLLCTIAAVLYSRTAGTLCNLIETVCVSFQGILMPNLEICFLYACTLCKIANTSEDTVTSLLKVRMHGKNWKEQQFWENSYGESHGLDEF